MSTPSKSRQSSALTNKVRNAPHGNRRNVKRTRNAGSPKLVTARLHEQDAFDLRLKGWSYRRIGAELGISYVNAYQSVMRVLEGIESDLKEKAPQVRQMELERLDKNLAAIEARCEAGDVKAVEAALKISHVRCRIEGIYAPDQVQHSGEITVLHSMADAAIDLEMQTLVAQVPELRQLLAAPVLEPVPVTIEAEAAKPAKVNGRMK